MAVAVTLASAMPMKMRNRIVREICLVYLKSSPGAISVSKCWFVTYSVASLSREKFFSVQNNRGIEPVQGIEGCTMCALSKSLKMLVAGTRSGSDSVGSGGSSPISGASSSHIGCLEHGTKYPCPCTKKVRTKSDVESGTAFSSDA